MKNFKKISSVLLTGVMAVSLAAVAACAPSGNEGGENEHLHTLSKTNAKSSSCKEKGNIEYWYCGDCGKYFTDGEAKNETTLAGVTLDFASHTLSKTDASDADCMTDGNIDYWSCSVCHKYFTDENGTAETTLEGVKVTGSHKLIKHPAVAEGCTTDGNVEYWSCSVCHKYFTDENGTDETDVDSVKIAAAHKLANHPATAQQWKFDGNIEYWDCTECHKYFADAEGDNEINLEDTVISAVAVPDTSKDDDVFVGNAKANKDFWTAANWATYSSANYGTYGNGSEAPTLVAADGETERHLLFAKAARFELFHVPGTGSNFTHLGENSQTGNSQWGNTDNFSGLYDNTFIYTFDVAADGAFAFEVFGLASSKADRSGQGTSLLFDKNTIKFFGGTGDGNNNQVLRAIATISDNFDFGDGARHTIAISIKRGAPDTTRTDLRSIIDYRIYVDGYMVRFVNQVDGNWNVADNDGILQICIGKNSGMGQRLSVIPQINSEEGAETDTYTQVRIFNLTIKRHYPETTESESVLTQRVAASLNEFFTDEQRDIAD